MQALRGRLDISALCAVPVRMFTIKDSHLRVTTPRLTLPMTEKRPDGSCPAFVRRLQA